MTYAQRARRYAEDVVAGRVPACKYVKLACQRHLDDLARQEDEGFPYWFDEDAANEVCYFIEQLPHVKGRWARKREKLVLEDWQCFVECCVFGWKREDGNRRYRRAYTEVPRKNAKSTVSAGNGLYMFAADGEHGAEVYSGATTEKQAWEVFGPARQMAVRTPEFREAFGVEVNARNMHILETNAKFEPIIGNPGDGASPSFAITDEYHEHTTETQYDTMVTGMGAREQPMAWVITTAGADTAGPCYALRTEVVNMLEGTVDNPELFGIIYTIDEGDDWTTPEALRKANPNIGVSVSEDFLLSQQRDAINNPRKQSTFKTKHLNVWVTAASPFFNLELWNRLADAPPIAEFASQPCWGGLDLASKLDITSYVKVFRRMEDGEEHFYVYGRHYLPEERVHLPEARHYEAWVIDGHLVATPGNVTDYDEIEAAILADAKLHRYVAVGFDPYNATQLASHLIDAGLQMVEVPQTTKNLSDPMKWVEALIVDGRIHHDGNPAMSWMMSNVTAQIDRNDNVFPRKEQAEKKIDGAVALIMAIGQAMGTEEQVSKYETGDLLVL